jgi:glycosyltransferase involved in cell wall biosynthesis
MGISMKILQVCSAESLGGGERHVMDLSASLIERGHELHLAVRPGCPLIAEMDGLPVIWHEMSLRNAMDVMSAGALASVIREHSIDVLHAHVARDYAFCGIAARMARPVRFFITRHHFNPIKANPVYAWTIGEARNLIAVSESVRGTLAEAFPAFDDRIVVVPNWIDTGECGQLSREVARARLGLTRRVAVAIIGQLTPLKRQDLFIQAASHLIKERLWADADFLIAGEPNPDKQDDLDYADHLVQLVYQFGVGDQVHFAGFVPNMRQLLSAFDVVVAPSDNEAFSLALVEAMAAGCACVATRVGGMADILENEITGLFAERDNLWSLVSAMSRLMTDKPLREKLGTVAQASVIERFDRDRVVDRIERLYMADDAEKAIVIKRGA